MREFFGWLIGMVLVQTVLFGLGLAFNLIDLQFLGWRTNAETHITRQTNAYLTAHQTALREMKAQYDDLDRQLAGTRSPRRQAAAVAQVVHCLSFAIPSTPSFCPCRRQRSACLTLATLHQFANRSRAPPG
jgi:hypothetical protein